MNPRVRQALTIFLGSILIACALGICLDLVTANVAVEYFSVHHPRIIPSENPWILAFVWGIAASWWFGAMAGVVVATINALRSQPLRTKLILRWAMIACVVLWLVMIAILLGVWTIASLIPERMRRPSFDYDRRIMAVAMAHQYEYILGGIAMLVIAVKVWRKKAPEIGASMRLDEGSSGT